MLLDQRKARFFEGFPDLVRELPELEMANPTQPAPRDGAQGRAHKAEEALGHYCKQMGQCLRDQLAARKRQQLLVGSSRVRVESFLPSLHPCLACTPA